MKKIKSKNNLNQLFLMMTCVFSTLLLITSCIACYYAYIEKKSQMLSSMDSAYSHMEQEYENILSNFWQVYMPIIESSSSTYKTFQNYFTAAEAQALTPLEKRTLTDILEQMRIRDNRIEWIALYSDNRSVNYIKFNDNRGVQELADTFPYLDDLGVKTTQMEIYGTSDIDTAYGKIKTFAICGGVPTGMGSGKILFGYRLNTFEEASSFQLSSVPSVRYYMLSNGQLLYDSFGEYDADNIYIPAGAKNGPFRFNGGALYVKSGFAGNNTSVIVYTAQWKDIFLAAHKDTFWILAITILFMVFSLFVHFSMSRSVAKEVSVIREGLNIIADDHPDYRIPTDFKQGGLPEIAQNINEMSSRLNDSVKKAYYFELKQKDAELAQLQATFNPHFLYNTLEMLRSKSYANGDEGTAGLIADLASIFRSLIGARTFVTLKEELGFCRKYLTLLSARYGDRVKVSYDIDTSLLNYGIIRNVFQILIENYFVHGFDADGADNLIRFTGKSLDGETMLITVEDNGFGMTEDGIAALNQKIEEPIRHGKESYGLKNLNQRLKLFYGPDYGLHIQGNRYGGLTVQINLRKICVEEYEKKKLMSMKAE